MFKKTKKYFLGIILSASIIFPSSFEINVSPIEVFHGEDKLDNPFSGGFNRPKIRWIDWDQDNDIDLFLLDNDGYIRYYENNGTSDSPSFKLISTNFFNLFANGWFSLEDFDSDGDYDIIVQDSTFSEYLHYYQNDGFSNFQSLGYIYQDSGLQVYHNDVMVPTFADIDNDGDYDFFSPNYIGTLTYYENVGFIDDKPIYSLVTDSWQNISLVGTPNLSERHGAAAIMFIDLDGDGDLDLSWGDWYQTGFYIVWNVGTVFQSIMDINNIIDSFPQDDPITTAGQNMPSFADLDNDGDQDLYFTVLSGAFGQQYTNNFYYYQNIGTSQNPAYRYKTNNYFETIDLLTSVDPELVDINNDGNIDLLISSEYDPSLFPWTGRIHLYLNEGDNDNPKLKLADTQFLGVHIGSSLSIETADIDGDGDMDIFIGESNGFIYYFENLNFESLNFSEPIQLQDQNGFIDLSGYSSPALADLDNDGDLDLLSGELDGDVNIYINEGQGMFGAFISHSIMSDVAEAHSAPEFYDFDLDGDVDLLIGTKTEGIKYLKNISQSNSINFILNNSVIIPHLGIRTKPTISSLMANDYLHLIVGISTGGIYYLNMETCLVGLGAGDINSDFIFNILDAVQLVNIILNESDISQCQFTASDINNDNNLNVLDLISLINIILES